MIASARGRRRSALSLPLAKDDDDAPAGVQVPGAGAARAVMRIHVCVVLGLVAAAFVSGIAAALAVAGSSLLRATRTAASPFGSPVWRGASIESIVEGAHEKGYSQVHAAYTSSLTINSDALGADADGADGDGEGGAVDNSYLFARGTGQQRGAGRTGAGGASDPELLVLSGDGVHVKRVSQLALRAFEGVDDGTGGALGRRASEAEGCPAGSRRDSKSQIKLLVAVMSTCCSLGSRRKRDAIRQTWVRDMMLEFPDVIGYKFVLSTPDAGASDADAVRALLREELQGGHDDILLLNDAVERYENLPQKTIETLRYMGVSACGYTHVLKTDDDVYVRAAGVLSLLGYQHAGWHVPQMFHEEMTGVYVGYVELQGGFRPVRDRQSKWYLSRQEWPDGVRPVKYAAGWGYVLSKDLSEYAVEKMDYYKSIAGLPERHPDLPVYYGGLLKLEDVMIGCVPPGPAPPPTRRIDPAG